MVAQRTRQKESLGLYGALIIDPKTPEIQPKPDAEYVIQLQEWLQRGGTYLSSNADGGCAAELLHHQGQSISIIGSNNNSIHPMHVHGGPFTVVARDGQRLPPQARFDADTVNVGPGQRYDVVWLARQPGKWLIHCHIGHHTTNNNTETQGGGGLTMVIEVTP